MADLPHHLEDVDPPEDVDLGPSLAERFFEGEHDAFVRVTKYLLVSLRGLPQSQIDDYVAEGICEAFVKREMYQEERNFLAWIATVARNKALSSMRKKQPLPSVMALEPIDQSFSETDNDDMFSESNNDKMLKMLRDCLQTLGEDFAEALRMHYFESLKYPDISKSIGKDIGTVSSRMNRGRAQVRDCMNKKLGDL